MNEKTFRTPNGESITIKTGSKLAITFINYTAELLQCSSSKEHVFTQLPHFNSDKAYQLRNSRSKPKDISSLKSGTYDNNIEFVIEDEEKRKDIFEYINN
jgi:hypothetical protein